MTPPAVEPISVDEARQHCRALTHDDDDYLRDLIVTARKRIENVCWTSLITQTWSYYWDRFWWKMFIPRPPLRYGNAVQSITSFKYVLPSVSGTPTYTDLDSTLWEVSAENQIPFLRLQYLRTWPITRGYRDDVMATVTSGYGDKATDVPAPIRHAIKLYVGFIYLNRGDEPAEFPRAIWDLVDDYRFKEI